MPEFTYLFVIGDTRETPAGIEVTPTLMKMDQNVCSNLIVQCIYPPYFMPKGQVIAQAFPLPKYLPTDGHIPAICWTEVLGNDKPVIECKLRYKSHKISIMGMIDTGADVSVIPFDKWPTQWELQSQGIIQGIGGTQIAKQSKHTIQIEGPEGQIATLRPYVPDTKFTLWGRDAMSQWGTKIDITPRHQNFPLQATEAERHPHKLTWKTDEPVWVNQWSLKKENLEALKTLVAEQLAKGNIVPTNSPWNTPVFVIQKPGKNKYRLLQDLREVNKVIEDMGPLQPGMPSPSMLPQHWHLAVLDIKDCFFHIPLHPADAPRFAFSVPSLNRETPMERYHWLVLPQGMKNSPTLCQEYIAKILSPIRAKAEKAIILHYMDDVLVCAPNNQYLEQTLNMVVEALEAKGFELQPEKMQRTSPWNYLGLKITETSITPTPVTINNNPKTLEEVQQICGTLKYLRSWLGLTTEDVAPIANLVKGEGGPASPRSLTEEARQSLKKIQELISTRQAHRYQPSLPFKLVILGKVPRFHGLIFQWDKEQKEPLIIIEWVFLPLQPPKTITQPQELMAKIIMKGRARLRTLAGCDFACIYLPVTTDALDHLLQNNINLQFALDSYSGQISNHYPKHDMFNLPFSFIPREIQSRKPLDAITVFTDASGKSKKSVVTWKNPKTQKWESDIQVIQGSPQVAELAAVLRAFERFKEPFNLVTDSAYVAGVTVRAEHALLKEISNKKIYDLLSKLIYLVSHREHPYFVMHVRSHTNLPGFIAEGNHRADALAMPADIVLSADLPKLPQVFEQAKLSHAMYHQNIPALIRMFHLSRTQAKAIVATCPNCQKLQLPSLGMGVNPRGINNGEVWQMDVTHFPEFGRLKYVHVSIDTFSGAMYASAHAGEKAKDVEKHLVQAFAVLGTPEEIKTDNGPAYTSQEFKNFRQQWGFRHVTGIPHSPTGQVIVEHAHQTLKRMLLQQSGTTKLNSPVF
uniref:Uncharacterized protein n=1 Tax=Corvus moneduloides TaxID=1196302 RepID=A0A8C3EM58_CORMO